MEQNIAAEKMNISRGTFQRIVHTGRKKIADALINGKAIRIDGGDYKIEGKEKIVGTELGLDNYVDTSSLIKAEEWKYGY